IRLYAGGSFFADIAAADFISTQQQGSASIVQGTVAFTFNAGTVLTFRVFHNSGAARNVLLDSVFITRNPGPAQVAASEVVTGYARISSGQVIPNNTDTTVTGWVKTSDTHSIFDASSGVLTINRSGFIDINSMIHFAGPNATASRTIQILYNNTTALTIGVYEGSSIGRTAMPIFIEGFPVIAGDTFRVRVFQNSGSGLALVNDVAYNSISWRIY
ncbi:MAG: hypothetical protein ACK5QX_07470, partial [bacterium]